MSKVTNTKKAEAIRGLWEAGMSPKEIAELMGLHVCTIHRILVRIGAREPDEKASKRLSIEERLDIIRLYQEGVTVEEIMEMVGCSKPTVYKWVNEAGLSRAITEDAVNHAIQLYKEGLAVREILQRTGLSKATFYRRLKQHFSQESYD